MAGRRAAFYVKHDKFDAVPELVPLDSEAQIRAFARRAPAPMRIEVLQVVRVIITDGKGGFKDEAE